MYICTNDHKIGFNTDQLVSHEVTGGALTIQTTTGKITIEGKQALELLEKLAVFFTDQDKFAEKAKGITKLLTSPRRCAKCEELIPDGQYLCETCAYQSRYSFSGWKSWETE